jgi:L-malate glycosyltransferase
MRILQLIQKKQLRGAELFAAQLSNQLKARGHEVKMIALQDGDALLPFSDIEILKTNTGLLFDFKAYRKLNELIKNWKPDVVQANAGDTLRTAVISQLIYGWKTPLIFRNASIMSRYLNSKVKKAYYSFLVKRVAAVASVSNTSKEDFASVFPFAASKISTIPIGIDPVNFDKSDVSWIGTREYILHVGGFSFEKNHRGLIEIFEMVRELKPDLQLLLAGNGPLFSEIKRLVNDKKLADHVLLLGQRSDINGLLKKASVLVLPSIIEGLPGVILEAMYCGVPVVAYNTGGIAEVLTNKTGWIIEKGNKEEFVKAVTDLLHNNATEKASRILNAKELVLEKYTNHLIAGEFEKLYQSLASKN